MSKSYDCSHKHLRMCAYMQMVEIVHVYMQLNTLYT